MELVYKNDSITVTLDENRKILSKIFSSSRITDLVINDNLETIEDNAMRDNYLKDINLKKVRFIGKSSFECNELSGILIIPETVEYIGKRAFCDNKIEEVIIKNYNTLIENDSFDDDVIITREKPKKLILK